MDDFTPEQVARGRALRRAQLPWALGARAAGLLLPLLLGLTPAGAGLVSWAGGLFGGSRTAQVLAGVALLLLLGELVQLPFAARLRVIRREYGLITQGWSGWAVDLLRGLALGLLLALPVGYGLYALTDRSPDGWWLPAALLAALLVPLLSFLFPLLVEPLFNRFTPLPEGELRTALLDLADRDAIRVREVLVADASRRTTALNAYVSGLGATRRIVAYDTLLSTADSREVELVVAHELGHVKHRDVLTGTLLGSLGAAVAVVLLGLLTSWQLLLSAADASSAADPRSLFLFAACAAVLGTLAGPFQCAASRRIEARADRHALELTSDPEQFIAMQRRLAVTNIADVDPPRLLHLLFATHPSATSRIAAARAWAAGTPGPRVSG
ncbi:MULTISPECIES: M48 family metalloprotease [unclassified Kitasatospora]|uniref:M48 family metalloprotease n=1 Tax=unclassified Kitasatospora TaxID=2633591 RepID=UPI00070A94AB|nr:MULTISPECIES: M48 family metalloprotease [unclassified Kitasatospora]KQV03306.1 peptidase M48 [Kitasatospora sp. Root107]KRB66111.1 peptidase M48 [Kitasatospora sp. Root187]